MSLKHSVPIWFISIFILFSGIFILNLLYVPECDEYCFTAWQFRTLWERLLSRPVQNHHYIIGTMKNGRILGNYFGIQQALMMFQGHVIPKALIFSSLILLCAMLMSRSCFEQRHFRIGIIISLGLLICTEREFYANVWSWGVSFVNYFTPMIGYLYVNVQLSRTSDLHEPAQKRFCLLLFIVAFCTQLFAETFTLPMLVFAMILLFTKKYQKYPKAPRQSAALGFVFGGIGMFLHPGYRATLGGDSIHTVAVGFPAIIHNVGRILWSGYLSHIVLMITLIALVILNAIRQNHPFRKIAQDFALSIASTVPCVLSLGTWGPRMFFPCYMFLLLCLLRLLPRVDNLLRTLSWIAFLSCILWFCNLIPIYHSNKTVDRFRIHEGLTQVAQGADKVTLPLLPYPEYATNEHMGKSDLSFVIYKEEPFDTELTFVPYSYEDHAG